MTPAELGALVDSYHEKRESRLNLQRQTDAVEKEEKELKKQIIELLQQNKISSIGGAKKRATLQTKNKPTVTSWPSLYAFIKQNDAFDLLQRRLTETAVQARWDDKLPVPGVQAYPVPDLSLSNV